MKIIWQIDENDVQKIKAFFDNYKDTPFVKNRINRNINKDIPDITKELFWSAMISCLLTTQQRSGPNSTVTKFIIINPFPLNYSLCVTQTSLQNFIENTITSFGGIRRAKTISKESTKNFNWLNNDRGWEQIFGMIKKLQEEQTKESERESVNLIIL